MLFGQTKSKRICSTMLIAGSFTLGASIASAVSPASIAKGRQLFEKNWSQRNPALMGNDGLGPLFNGQSCAVCHRQGGIGGAGEAEFNAKTISIESMRIVGGPITRDVIHQAVRGFHPGFVDPQAGVVNSLTLHHHGGTPAFAKSRQNFIKSIPAVFSENGGSVSAAEVRRANATPILYTANVGNYKTTINARMFQRNTTPLFGAGLIDQVTSKQLRSIEREQKKHPEISGRLATLPNGRMGRFGWRGNVPSLLDFCDQACAAEVGLKTRRIDQPADPMRPRYRNPTYDISDSEIKAMTAFVSALPAPTRAIPKDSDQRRMAARGEQVFTSVGCAVCHRPTTGPATGVYSDLLLHDMGRESYDLNPADPYIVRVTPSRRVDYTYETESSRSVMLVDDTVMGTRYYGGKYSMEPGITSTMNARSRTTTVGTGLAAIPIASSVATSHSRYLFRAAPVPPAIIRFIPQSRTSRTWVDNQSESSIIDTKVSGNEKTASGKNSYKSAVASSNTQRLTELRTDYLRIHTERTFFTQEWRTPPLWGVDDSAPYMHDGRAETLLESITMHGGESEKTRDRFLVLSLEDRHAMIAFLETLVAPPNAPQPQS